LSGIRICGSTELTEVRIVRIQAIRFLIRTIRKIRIQKAFFGLVPARPGCVNGSLSGTWSGELKMMAPESMPAQSQKLFLPMGRKSGMVLLYRLGNGSVSLF
jgi:hypothetical protein